MQIECQHSPPLSFPPKGDGERKREREREKKKNGGFNASSRSNVVVFAFVLVVIIVAAVVIIVVVSASATPAAAVIVASAAAAVVVASAAAIVIIVFVVFCCRCCWCVVHFINSCSEFLFSFSLGEMFVASGLGERVRRVLKVYGTEEGGGGGWAIYKSERGEKYWIHRGRWGGGRSTVEERRCFLHNSLQYSSFLFT